MSQKDFMSFCSYYFKNNEMKEKVSKLAANCRTEEEFLKALKKLADKHG